MCFVGQVIDDYDIDELSAKLLQKDSPQMLVG